MGIRIYNAPGTSGIRRTYHGRAIAVVLLRCLLTLLEPTGASCDPEYPAAGQDALEHDRPALDAPGYIAPDEEAPPALLDTQLGDADVSLFLTGHWAIDLIGSVGLKISALDHQPTFEPFPGMTPGFIFSQSPDFSLFLSVEDRYTFEASFIDGYELNRYVLGYDGRPGELLQSVRIGNADIGFGDYPYASVGDTPPDTLGAAARFAAGPTAHEAALRIQPSGMIRQSYLGTRRVDRYRLHPSTYVEGRVFVLPDTGISDLEIHIAVDPSDPDAAFTASDGRTYAPADASVYSASEDLGTVVFSESIQRRVLVTYTKDGFRVGAPALGSGALPATDPTERFPTANGEPVDFEFSDATYLGVSLDSYRVRADGQDYLLLFDPTAFSPFEHAGYYPFSAAPTAEGSRATVRLTATEPAAAGETPVLEPDFLPELSLVRFRRSGGASDEPASRYPLLNSLPEIYGPNREVARAAVRPRLLVEISTPVEAISLLQPVAGTVRVTVNGRPDRRFTISGSDTLELDFVPLPTDRIEVTYRSRAAEAAGSDVAIAYGTRSPIGDRTEVSAALSTIWNIAGSSFSTRRYDHPGSLVASGSVEYTGERLSLSAEGAATVTSPDTSNAFRLRGSASQSAAVPVAEGRIFPASPPIGLSPSTDMSADRRGRLIYKNYFSSTSSGGRYLNPYNWPGITEDRVAPYAAGGVTGPYLASAVVAGTPATAAVIDYELDPEHTWVGAILRIPAHIDMTALGRYSGIEFAWLLDGEPPAAAHVQIGAIGEDLDDDGTLDREDAPDQLGFSFNDPAAGVSLRAGTRIDAGNGIRDSEDADVDGLLDPEVPDAIVTRSFVPADAGFPRSSWSTVRIEFSAAERRALRSGRAIRILLEHPDADARTGRLLIARPTFTGTEFAPVGDTEGVSVRGEDTEDVLSALESAFPAVARRFHRDVRGEYIRVDLPSELPQEQIEFRSATNTASLHDYSALVFFLRGREADVTIRLEDDSLRGVSCRIVLPDDSQWHEVVCRYREGSVSIDGREAAQSAVSYDPTSGEVSHLTMLVHAAPSATLYLDEIHLADSLVSVGAGGDFAAGYELAGAVVSIGSYPLLSALRISQTVSGATRRFSPVTSNTSSGCVEGETELELTVGPAALWYFVDLSAAISAPLKRPDVSCGHRVTVPAAQAPITITDGFTIAYNGTDRAYSRRNSLSISAFNLFALQAVAEANIYPDGLDQRWELSTRTGSRVPFRTTTRLSLYQDGLPPPAPLEGYGPNLLESYVHLLPGSTSRGDHGLSASSTLGIPFGSFSLRLQPILEIAVPGSLPRTVETEGAVTLSIPVEPSGTDGLIATVQLGRGFSSQVDLGNLDIARLGTAPGILGEAWATLSELPAARHLYSPPGADLFLGRTASLFAESVTETERSDYDTSLELTLARSTSTGAADLLLPRSAATELGRRLVYEYAGVSDIRTYAATVRWSAVNLFGSLGTRPRTSLFQSDEYAYSVSLAYRRGHRDQPSGYQAALTSGVAFFAETLSLSIGNVADITYDDTLTFDTTFTAELSSGGRLAEGLTIPFLNIFVENEVYLQHVEALEAAWTGGDSGLAVRLSHETEVSLGTIGRASGAVDLGVRTVLPAGSRRREWAFGLEGAIRLQLSL